MQNIEARLDKLEDKIKQPNVRESKGLGNEVGYYIFDYLPKQELIVRERIRYLISKYEGTDIKIAVFDIYDIIIDMLEKEGFIEICEGFEKSNGIDEISKAINEMLRMEEDNYDNELLSHIKDNTPKDSIIFLIGVGKCFPLLRSHKILNNMHQFIDNIPVIMFFPGEYDSQQLSLFGKIKDGNYYRALRIVE